ncbi:MAG TPA: UDP-glucose 6-dehydrogenase, partial [Aliiroseovarius sp.]|nr:UDP-glucose 6-dehydrogenase [Aliiroseovarius sp.]
MKIVVAGIGYVGLSNAVLLSQNNSVTAIDLDDVKVEGLNARRCLIEDPEMQDFLKRKDLDLRASTDGPAAYADADFVIIATPTNYDPVENFFDTSSVEAVAQEVLAASDKAVIVIKSTIPVGFVKALREKLG